MIVDNQRFACRTGYSSTYAREMMMGFLDDLSDSFSDAKAAVGRSTSTMKLNSQLNEIKRRREGLVTQLGASLYDVTKDDPKLRAGREALYDGIAQCDIERSQISARSLRSRHRRSRWRPTPVRVVGPRSRRPTSSVLAVAFLWRMSSPLAPRWQCHRRRLQAPLTHVRPAVLPSRVVTRSA